MLQPDCRVTVSSADLEKSKSRASIFRELGSNLSTTKDEFSSQNTDTRLELILYQLSLILHDWAVFEE